MPPKIRRRKNDPALDAFLETETGQKLFTALTSCADGLRGLAEFVQDVLPGHLAPPASRDPTPEAGGKKQRRKKDPDAPKRANSAYLLFYQDIRPALQAEHPEWRLGDMAEEVGKRWRNATPEVKKPYLERAAEDRQKYFVEVQAYRQEKGLPPIAQTPAAKRLAPLPVHESSDESEQSGDDDSGTDDESPAEVAKPAPKAAGTSNSAKKLVDKAAKARADAAAASKKVAKKGAEPAVPEPIVKANGKTPASDKKEKKKGKAEKKDKPAETAITTPTKTPNGTKRKADESTAAETPTSGEKKRRRNKKKKSLQPAENGDAAVSEKAATTPNPVPANAAGQQPKKKSRGAKAKPE